jgi:hypothetical protein
MSLVLNSPLRRRAACCSRRTPGRRVGERQRRRGPPRSCPMGQRRAGPAPRAGAARRSRPRSSDTEDGPGGPLRIGGAVPELGELLRAGAGPSRSRGRRNCSAGEAGTGWRAGRGVRAGSLGRRILWRRPAGRQSQLHAVRRCLGR